MAQGLLAGKRFFIAGGIASKLSIAFELLGIAL